MSALGIGRVIATRGAMLVARLPAARVGDAVRLDGPGGAVRVGSVEAVERGGAALALHGPADGLAVGDRVELDPAALSLVLGMGALGRAFDSAGLPLDGGESLRGRRRRIDDAPISPARRAAIAAPFWTGVRAIDGLLTIGRGARVGLFGAPGAGKSTLLEALARGACADAVVVALIGERGREAARWTARVDPRTSIVCAPADRAPAERIRAAEVALAHAAALRERGLDVLVILDSLARYAGAARETALALGEPAGRGGFPPGVFVRLARLLERAGATRAGSITLVATVLTDGDDGHDPVAEAARAALDGHIILSSALGRAGRYPAIDVPASASRTMGEVVSPEHAAAARTLRAALALLDETKDARTLGVVPAGSDPRLDRAIAAEVALERFLRQGGEPERAAETLRRLIVLADTIRNEP